MNDLIQARLVYDGGDVVKIPSQMGSPRADQMQGTPAEQLCELAGRVCYDSLGIGRPSFGIDGKEGYHDHIAKVGHGSVWEHFNFTVEIECSEIGDFPGMMARILLNRPGIWSIYHHGIMRVTANLRALREWSVMTTGQWADAGFVGSRIVNSVLHVAPHILERSYHPQAEGMLVKRVDPAHDEECWISLFVSGSRGLSHELVRHGDFTAISQRSTRFVDESESDWVEHPLVDKFDRESASTLVASADCVKSSACSQYRHAVAMLEPWLASRGVDKTSARKQARGAARGYLGNALYTELIFSASVSQWKRILRQRASVFADAEIREMACKALVELKSSRYGSRFANWQLQESPDGIGQVANEIVE